MDSPEIAIRDCIVNFNKCDVDKFVNVFDNESLWSQQSKIRTRVRRDCFASSGGNAGKSIALTLDRICKVNCRLIEFVTHCDGRGKLVAIEGERDIPFEIKRVFYIYDTVSSTDSVKRGMHANMVSEQVLVCVNGSCVISLDDGDTKEKVKLYKKNIGLYVGKNIWREIKEISNDCILMVMTNEYYDSNEYIRDYKEFLRRARV